MSANFILDRKKSYGTVIGHVVARYEQDGKLFDVSGNVVVQEPPAIEVLDHIIIETDEVDSAKRFLQHVLNDKPLTKSVLFKLSQDNNQSWDAVNKAATLLGVVKFSYNKATVWKLPEEVGAL